MSKYKISISETIKIGQFKKIGERIFHSEYDLNTFIDSGELRKILNEKFNILIENISEEE